jgi:biopolymer transport protein ExbB/TolQ
VGETATTAAHDLSILSLVLNADIVVQAVMAGLVLASVACWALVLEKIIRMIALRRARREIEAAAKGEGFTGRERSRLAKAVHAAAYAEATEGAAPDESQNDRRARLERAMRTAMKSELKRVESGLPFLATTGSAAPFIGLFGTVWGIMNSFTAIAQQKDTSLAVVAPGIAEALFATALGLAAAIPAVIAYNQFAVRLGGVSEKLSISIAILAKKMARRGLKPGAREEAA